MTALRVGTRGSALALTQTRTVAAALAGDGPPPELVTVVTAGDTSTAPLDELGGTGAFATALREALLDGRCDVIVHSLKDLPVAPHPGLVIAAIPVRADPRDALCARDGLTLGTLPPGSRVGTGSPRRSAQVRARRDDLEVVGLRGNVDTRLAKVASGELDAVVLAAAGLDRLGRADAITEHFELTGWPTAPGQGALAVEVRAGEDHLVRALDHEPTRATVTAERTLLGMLQAGCSAPVGAHAEIVGDRLVLAAAVYGDDRTLRAHQGAALGTTRGSAAVAATQVALRAAAELLVAGAGDLIGSRA